MTLCYRFNCRHPAESSGLCAFHAQELRVRNVEKEVQEEGMAEIPCVNCDAVIEVPTPSLRDHFAMAALTGLIAAEFGSQNDPSDVLRKAIAAVCYSLADAMIAERDKVKP